MRIIAHIFALLLLSCALGQTATTAPKGITTGPPGQVTQPVTFTYKGSKISFYLQPAWIPPVAVNIPALPVTLPPGTTLTLTFTCTIPPDSQTVTNPDGTKTITGIKCSAVQQ